jgi:hypothetical protein
MDQIRIKYVRDSRKNPVGCVAYTVSDGQLRVGLASCNPKDPFKKEISRSLAIGRLMTSPETTTAPTERSLQALTLSVLEMAQASGNASSRVSRMAAREVKKVVTTAGSK